DRVLFKERRALRRDGWISKPPPRRSLDTRYRYVKPGHTHNGEEGSDYFLGERSLVDYYLKLHNNVVQCIGDTWLVSNEVLATAFKTMVLVVILEQMWEAIRLTLPMRLEASEVGLLLLKVPPKAVDM
ncbi:hypothetical protein JG688_00016196, partial [Phytophthora aleatoria]